MEKAAEDTDMILKFRTGKQNMNVFRDAYTGGGNSRRKEGGDEERFRVTVGQEGGMRTRKLPGALRAGHFYFFNWFVEHKDIYYFS